MPEPREGISRPQDGTEHADPPPARAERHGRVFLSSPDGLHRMVDPYGAEHWFRDPPDVPLT